MIIIDSLRQPSYFAPAPRSNCLHRRVRTPSWSDAHSIGL